MNTILLLMAMVCQQPVDKSMFEMLPSTQTEKPILIEEPSKRKMYTMKDKYGVVWQNSNKEYLIEDVEKINAAQDPEPKPRPKKFYRAKDKFGRTWQAETSEQLKIDIERANAVNPWPVQRYNIQPQQFRGIGASSCPPGASS